MNHLIHPFKHDDYVKCNTGHAKGVGIVETVGAEHITVRWLEKEDANAPRLWHWSNLRLTDERPKTAKEGILEKLREERNRITEERTQYLSDSNKKLADLDIAIRAVDAVEL